MPKRSLFNQFNQIRGTIDYVDLSAYANLAEQAGRSYLDGTLAVVSGSAMVTDSSNVFNRYEVNSFIVIPSGAAAGVYQITASGTTGNNNASVTPVPTATDASVTYRRHYYQNLEDDLNYLRTMVNLATGETNWYDEPATALSGKSNVGHTHDDRYYTETEVDTNFSPIGHNHDGSYDALGAASSAVSGHESTYDHTSFATHTEVLTTSGVLQDQINSINLDFASDAELTAVSGVLQTQIDALDTTYATDAELASVSGTLQGEIDAISTDLSSNYYTKTELDSGQLDSRYYTETETDGLLSTLSGTLQSQIDDKSDVGHTHTEADITDLDKYTQAEVDSMFTTVSGVLQSQISDNATDITNNYNTLDFKIDTTSGTLQDQIDSLDGIYATDAELLVVSGSLQTQITNVVNDLSTNYYTSAETDNIISSVSGTLQSQIDSLDSTYATDAELTFVSGTLQSEIDTLTSDLSTVSGSLQNDIIWEVVDTPYQQIRPKAAHMGKAIYTSGNLTIGGDLTVSGTTTTIHSEELTVTDKIITVNNGEVGAGITGSQYAGIEVDRGSEANYLFAFDEVQDNFRVGISGTLQAVATREDTPTDQYVAYWNASATRFDTVGGISISDIASESFVTTAISTLSGTLQDEIDAVALDLSTNYYTSGQVDTALSGKSDVGHTHDERYYTETEVDGMFASLSGTVTGDYYTKSEIDSMLGDYYTATQTDSAISSALTGYATESYVNNALSSYSTTTQMNSAIASALVPYYTSAQVDSLLAAQDTFLELDDVALTSYSDGRVLFTTTSGVTDNANFTFDTVSGTLSTLYLQLELGAPVNEIVDTVTSGSLGSQIPTAEAVWNLSAAAAAAAHSHYDEDCTYVDDYTWTYDGSFTALPEAFTVFVNGVKQRANDSDYYTTNINAGAVEISFAYTVTSGDWVNITWIA